MTMKLPDELNNADGVSALTNARTLDNSASSRRWGRSRQLGHDEITNYAARSDAVGTIKQGFAARTWE